MTDLRLTHLDEPGDSGADGGTAPLAKITPAQVRYKMTIAYDGTLFHGWQKQQPPGQESLRTVQGVVEAAVALTVGQRVNLVGASRTDAGVHALGQVAQFDAATRIPVERLALAINSRLPVDVEIRKVEFAPHDFEAITQAHSKQYRYRVFNSSFRPLQQRTCVYHCWWELDVARMNEAASLLVGRRDFAGFTAAGHGRLTTVRTVHHCSVERVTGAVPGADEVHIIVQGDGFLYNMVRIIAGTLLEVGRGAMDPARVAQAVAAGDRRLAGPTLPPQGLWLEWISYGEEVNNG